MDNVKKYLDLKWTSLQRTKFLTVAVLCFAAASVAASLYISYDFVRKHTDTIYIVDQGSTVAATLAKGDSQRDWEANVHVERFHELMFTLSPDKQSIERRIETALSMADKTAYDYYMDQSERQYYQRLISANISQEIAVDSIRINMAVYPYTVKTFAKVYLTRESNVTAYDFESECVLSETGRSISNPQGLQVERFLVTKYESLGSRKRR